jgi:hypothetical protein
MHEPPSDDTPLLISRRTVDIGVAALLLLLAIVFAYESYKLGAGWQEGTGPAAGFFPFIVSVMLGVASLFNIFGALRDKDPGADEDFITLAGLARITYVLLPLAAFVFAIHYIGIYVASAVFIAGFMMVFGRNGIVKSAVVGIGVPLVLFFMFERWFLVPLPKGPLEAMLGY